MSTSVYKDNKNVIIGESKEYAIASKYLHLQEWKALIFALSKVNFKESLPSEVHISKKELADAIGLHSDSTDLASNLYKALIDLPKNSQIEIKKETGRFYRSSVLVTDILIKGEKDVIVKFNTEALQYFGNLKNGEYITLLASDILGMSSVRAITFYEFLRVHSDTRITNEWVFTTKQLKTMFKIPKDGKGSYIKGNGHFNRWAFEQQVIEPLIRDLQKCKMIRLLIDENGKFYEKEKEGNTVIGYRFKWVFPKGIENLVNDPKQIPEEATNDKKYEDAIKRHYERLGGTNWEEFSESSNIWDT